MRTVHCSGRLGGGVEVLQEGEEGVCLGSLPAGRQHPPWTEKQTGVKTLPCRNYIVDGNNHSN